MYFWNNGIFKFHLRWENLEGQFFTKAIFGFYGRTESENQREDTLGDKAFGAYEPSASIKKTQKTPKKEIERALKLMNEYYGKK